MSKLTLHLWTIQFLVVATGIVAVSSAEATDLVQVDIHSYQQARQAESLYGSAVARVGNTFYVLVDGDTEPAIDPPGPVSRIVVREVNRERLYLVSSSDHLRGRVHPDPVGLGERVILGDGRYFQELSSAEVESLPLSFRISALQPCRGKVLFKYVPPASSMGAFDNSPHDTLAALVSQDSLFTYNKRLEDFVTRFITTDSVDRVRDWLVSKFEGFGYTDVSTQEFYHSSIFAEGYAHNVVAVKEGAVEPDKVVVIGAHYDSFTTLNREEVAPGADDNGSGTVLVMELARVLADAELRKTVVFIAFSAEEPMNYGYSGSEHAAGLFYAANTSLEIMFNYDMVGYNENEFYELDVHSNPHDAYWHLATAAAGRTTDLIMRDPGSSRPGDNLRFEDLGYPTFRVEEGEFNEPNYHLPSDLVSEMDFEYLTEVTKMALVTLATVADAPYPIELNPPDDPGDGQSLLFSWDGCDTDVEYEIFWGPSGGAYTDSAIVPAGQCTYTITGLAEGETYQAVVLGETPEGFRSVYGVPREGTPLLYPRQPANLVGQPQTDALTLSINWTANAELDLSHYNIYRRYGPLGAYSLLAEGVTETSYVDHNVIPHVAYQYGVAAVDLDGLESELAESATMYPATFDGGIAVADGFVQDHDYDPDQAWQEAWLDTVLGGVGFGVLASDENGGPLSLGELGEYSTVIWIDDDVIEKNIAASDPALSEFGDHATNMLVSGFQTILDWSPRNVPTDHLLRRGFGLQYYETISHWDFQGAHGQNGWPSVAIDETRGPAQWPYVAKLTPVEGATVIATFDSFYDLPGWEGEPVGLAYESPNGKRVLLSFPLFYLTPSSAQALMTKALDYFDVGVIYDKGDLDHSGLISLADLVLLLDHLFISMDPLPDPEAADMDGRPGVSIGDAFVLIDYLFLGGPQPAQAGCGSPDGM